MKQVRIHDSNDVRLDDIAEPKPGDDDVVVRVSSCGICGTDLKYIAAGGLVGPTAIPMPLGHELSGEVEFVGDNVEDVSLGDRMIVHPGDDEVGRIGNGGPEGALTTHLLVRDAARGGRLMAIPEQMPMEVAALAEPMAVGLNAANQAEVREGGTVAVFGAGPIGLSAIAASSVRGARDIVAIDMAPERLEVASKMGAHETVLADEDVWNVLRERHGSQGHVMGPTAETNSFIEATGSPSVIRSVIDHSAPGGILAVVALHFEEIPTSFLSIMMKELTIRGAMEYPKRFEDAIDLLSQVDVSAMITHRFDLQDWPKVLETVLGPRTYAKVMVNCQ